MTVAYHLTTGTPCFEACRIDKKGNKMYSFPVSKPCRVLMIEQEIGEQDLQERFGTALTKIEKHELFGENLFIHSCDRYLDLQTPLGIQRLNAAMESVKPDVLILDPLAEFHTLEENSAQDMMKILHNLDQLRAKFKCAVIIVHHVTKPTKDSPRSGPEHLRGSGVLFAKGDTYLMVKPHGRKQGRLQIDFTLRRGKPIHSLFLQVDFDSLLVKFLAWKNDPNWKQKVGDGLEFD